ncbi:MAG: alpha/beta hydrolase [Pseudolabrys sp.]|nr:alpha/beta hydrolase [Pseudolabrys sp.]
MDVERGFVKTHMGQIHYRAAGTGNAIMLFHITQQSSTLLLELMEALHAKFRVIAIDFPSHGASDHVTGQTSIEDYGKCAVAVMDALRILKCYALGEAAGAIVATELAGAYPERVEKIVVVNVPFVTKGTTKDTGAKVTDLQRPSDTSGFPLTRTIDYVLKYDAVHAPMHPTQSWMDRLNVAHMEAGRDRWQGMNAMHAYDFPGKVAKLRCPVFAIYGEHFYFTPFRTEFTARLKQVEIEVVKDARLCVTWEYPDQVAAKSLQFFSVRQTSPEAQMNL